MGLTYVRHLCYTDLELLGRQRPRAVGWSTSGAPQGQRLGPPPVLLVSDMVLGRARARCAALQSGVNNRARGTAIDTDDMTKLVSDRLSDASAASPDPSRQYPSPSLLHCVPELCRKIRLCTVL